MITCFYSCDACGIKSKSVQVPARSTEDVVYWMREIVARVLSDDHDAQSPHCRPKTLTEVKIPLPPESEFIGQQIE